MGDLFRRLRGLAGVGLLWGTLWAMIGAVIGVVLGFIDPELYRFGNPIFEWAFGIGIYGAVSGVGFGGLLWLREGKKTLMDLSLPRIAMWGVMGSALVPLLFLSMFAGGTSMADIVGAMMVTAGLGGVFAPGQVAIARRAELQAREELGMLDSGNDSDRALTD